MPIRQTLQGKHAEISVYTDHLEARARQQLLNIAELPIVHRKLAAMPDAHAGIGATVGSVIPTLDAIIPAAVGVDIGCGMLAVQLSLTASDLPENLKQTRLAIEQAVPVGFSEHKTPSVKRSGLDPMWARLRGIVDKHPGIERMQKKFQYTWARQLGTLGGGNHFIEVCLDETECVWVMLHSGSRGIGNAIGRYFIQLAKKDMRKHLANLPDRDLAYLSEGSPNFEDYLLAVTWAQEYAASNRTEMLRLVLKALRQRLPPFKVLRGAIDCHHNYVAREHHFGRDVYVTRKGAIRAFKDDLGIIPGSMGTCSYIVRGSGAADALGSCAHGAGRRMSRREARRCFELDQLLEQTRDVECRKDEDVIDEIPGAYKDIDEVMAHQGDLVTVEHKLKQVICVKG